MKRMDWVSCNLQRDTWGLPSALSCQDAAAAFRTSRDCAHNFLKAKVAVIDV